MRACEAVGERSGGRDDRALEQKHIYIYMFFCFCFFSAMRVYLYSFRFFGLCDARVMRAGMNNSQAGLGDAQAGLGDAQVVFVSTCEYFLRVLSVSTVAEYFS